LRDAVHQRPCVTSLAWSSTQPLSLCDAQTALLVTRHDRSPIRVLFYEPYPQGLGGNYLTQRLLLSGLDRQRFLPTVVAPMDGAVLDRFRAMGIKCVIMPPPGEVGSYGGAALRAGFLGRLKTAFDLAKYNLQLARLFRELRIDVVYANCVRAQLTVGLGAILARKPTLLYVKAVLSNPIIDRLSFLLATRIAFQSESNAAAKYSTTIRLFRSKVVIIRPGLDPKEILRAEDKDLTSLRTTVGIDGKALNTIVLGQLSSLKGVHCVIQALARIVREYPAIRLYIVGDCVLDDHKTYRRELHEMVKRLELEAYVRFLGWRSDSLEILRCMSIVIQPSFEEGFSGVVLESMAMERPLVATAVGGHGEIIEDGINGFLVSPGDVDAIVLRWRELLSSQELRTRLGREAKHTILSEYLIEGHVDQFSAVCLDMTRGSQSVSVR